ncbi:MAG TPA: DUF4384 domain-containing protein [Stellaceae bacterium]|nr:DUF4384 domain-containing protein [Stellaceae bacterium]
MAGAACGVIGAGETLTDAQQVIADIKTAPADVKGAEQRPGELTISAAANHADRAYRVGEPIALSVAVNQAAYVAVLRVMPNGATTLVFPNRRQPSAQVPADVPLRLPELGGPAITADKPGAELFEFIASSRGGLWLFHRKPEPPGDFAEFGTTTREVARDIVRSLRGPPGSSAATHLVLRVAGD